MHVSPLPLRRRTAWMVAGLVAVCAAPGLALTAPAAGVARTAAATRTLVLVRRDPAVARGSGFRAHSQVRVVLLAQRPYTRRVLTSRHGTFTVTFPAVVDRCSGWTLMAVQRASAPMVVHGARPECAPASTP